MHPGQLRGWAIVVNGAAYETLRAWTSSREGSLARTARTRSSQTGDMSVSLLMVQWRIERQEGGEGRLRQGSDGELRVAYRALSPCGGEGM